LLIALFLVTDTGIILYRVSMGKTARAALVVIGGKIDGVGSGSRSPDPPIITGHRRFAPR
jgi:hypothetical protein